MPKRIEIDNELFEKLYRYENKTLDEIAKTMGVSRHLLMRRKKELGIIRLFEDVAWLRQEYIEKQTPPRDMAKEANCSIDTLRVYMNKYGIPILDHYRPIKYSYNDSFFEVVDTEEKAYWLGFIVADGGISNDKHNRRLSIQLSAIDKGHLEKLAKALDTEVPIKEGKTYLEATSKWYDYVLLRIYSKKVVDDLINLGVYPNKSTREIVPTFHSNHIKAFIRGLFDGDGCFSCWKAEKVITLQSSINIVSSKEVLEYVSSVIEHELDIKAPIKPDGKIYRLDIGGNNQVKKIMNWLYDSSTIHLDRKYEKWQTFNMKI